MQNGVHPKAAPTPVSKASELACDSAQQRRVFAQQQVFLLPPVSCLPLLVLAAGPAGQAGTDLQFSQQECPGAAAAAEENTLWYVAG